MKRLLYIPIVHNRADLGSLGSRLSLEGERKYGSAAWQNHLDQVDKSWREIEVSISRQLKKTAGEKIKIFQDGLPVVGEIGLQIIHEAAAKGSKNYSIIENLLTRGAQLEIAENKELLITEYNLLSDISKADSPDKQLKAYMAYQERSKELLNSRDFFIANQINTALKEGDVGVAFFGAAHLIIDKINKDINVREIQLFRDDISLKLMNHS